MTFLGNLLILFGILALLLSGLFFFTGKKNEDFFSVRDNVKISIWNCFYPHENIDKKKLIENALTIDDLLNEKLKLDNSDVIS